MYDLFLLMLLTLCLKNFINFLSKRIASSLERKNYRVQRVNMDKWWEEGVHKLVLSFLFIILSVILSLQIPMEFEVLKRTDGKAAETMITVMCLIMLCTSRDLIRYNNDEKKKQKAAHVNKAILVAQKSIIRHY